jgi:putative tryptophan/tyrosine transport system substrate-binding protein
VRAGYVDSLARPGGNATGVTFIASALEAKRLEVLHELAPRAHSIAALFGPSNRRAESERREMEAAARTLGLSLRFLQVRSDAELEAALAAIVGERPDALHFVTDAFFYARAARLGAFVAEIGIPAAFSSRRFVELGGLLSYGASTEEAYRAGGRYVAKILKGAKPADLPVEQADKIALVINLKASQALGIDVPPTLLSRADEVIE